jgi:hypothetical protein
MRSYRIICGWCVFGVAVCCAAGGKGVATRLLIAPIQSNTANQHDYRPDTLVEYTRRIQPILMNGCGLGACHGNNDRHGYALTRPGTAPLTALQTRQNLARTLALVDRDSIDESPLLRKALEAHGGAVKPPLGGRDSAAYQNLDAWVKKLVPAKPVATPAADTAAEAFPTGESAPPGGSGFASERDEPSPKSSAKDDAPSSPPSSNKNPRSGSKEGAFGDAIDTAGADSKPKKGPMPTPASDDPFDPEIFNRQYHKK